MRRLVLAALAAILAASALGSAPRAETTATTPRLTPFGSCGRLLDYVRPRASRYVGPRGFGVAQSGVVVIPTAPAAPVAAGAGKAGVDYSPTNVQEEGVDEPDLVKTNGTTLFAVADGGVNAVDVRGAAPMLLDSLPLDAGWDAELLLYGDRLLVLMRGGFWIEPQPAAAAAIQPYQPATSRLAEIDVSDPKRLRLVRTLELDGSYVEARLVGGSARVVVASQIPSELPFVRPDGQTQEALDAATERNRAIVAAARATSWLPAYRITRAGRKPGAARPLVQCRHVARPPGFSGFGMLTVLTIDLAKGLEPVDAKSVLTDGRIVYASRQSLYVATERWAARPAPDAPAQERDGVRTEIHRFDISSPLRTQYRGSGSVSGYLLNRWSLSEREGVLRVVSTERPAWWGLGGGETESFLTTLRQRDAALVQAGRVGGLGKGEQVFAVRFVGDAGYVVTFRQVDPLYALDLSDPERPRVAGELKIPGYSAYLHPIGEDLLLGVGQDATEEGRTTGTQLSIFDVSDLRRPARLSRRPLGPGWSEAEREPRAFLFWPKTGLAIIPFAEGAVGFRVGRARGIDPVGRVEDGAGAAIRRSLVVRDSVLTVSTSGVSSSSLATLARRGWVAFPAATKPRP